MSDWEAVIGLEVHAQLRTETKLFSSAPNAFGGEPNTQTTEVDLGLPGVLPVINQRAVELALRAALALGCEVQRVSRFARKHYFYPDLPKGYQISQYEEPYALGGEVPVLLDGEVGTVPLTRIHMEEDAAKSIHDDAITGPKHSHINLNRAGVPLIEIVSEPELRSAEQASAYLRSLRSTLRYLDVSSADMEKGHLRCDANVSVRRRWESKLGTKVELKNLNSFRFLENAIEHEIERQIDVLEDGGTIRQETRHWDERKNSSRPSRSKEDADDYRYFPDPDLIPLIIDDAWTESVRKSLPELPLAKRTRYIDDLGITAADADLITEDRELAAFFEATLDAANADAKTVANWTIRSVRELANEAGSLADLALTPDHVAEVLGLLGEGKVTAASARELLQSLAERAGDARERMTELGLEAVSDSGELEALAQGVLDANPAQVEQYRGGDQKVLNFLMGQVMKQTQGKANPAAVREILARLLAV